MPWWNLLGKTGPRHDRSVNLHLAFFFFLMELPVKKGLGIFTVIAIGLVLSIIPFVANNNERPISFQVALFSSTTDPDEPGPCAREDGYKYVGFPFMTKLDNRICNGQLSLYPMGFMLNMLIASVGVSGVMILISNLRRRSR
jgi:hypothetical protein